MCEETEEVKESRVAGVKKGEGHERSQEQEELNHGVSIDHFKDFLVCPECDGKPLKVFQKVNGMI